MLIESMQYSLVKYTGNLFIFNSLYLFAFLFGTNFFNARMCRHIFRVRYNMNTIRPIQTCCGTVVVLAVFAAATGPIPPLLWHNVVLAVFAAE